ncbi:glycosyltransferase family 4 protein [Chloroflexota bacterium]
MAQKTNVMLVIDHWGFGGAQRVVRGLLNKWDNRDIKLFCYALRKSSNELEQDNDKEYFFSSKHKSKYSVLPFFELKKLIGNNNIGILHLHLTKAIVFGILLKTLYYRNIKIIVHEHGKAFKNNWLYNLFLRCVKTRVHLFIAVSEATKRKLIENAGIPGKKIKTLYDFVDLEHFNSQKIKINRLEERGNLGLNESDFVIGFAGRLSKVKGCQYLIKAVPHINIPGIKVLIAGDGAERAELEKLAEDLNIKDKITFLGYFNKMSNFYHIIDILVVPSRFESFGIVVIEAQASGIPVVASDVGALNELIEDGENGLLFDFANERDLAEKVELIEKGKDLREKLIKNGLHSVTKYSLETYLESLALIYGDETN